MILNTHIYLNNFRGFSRTVVSLKDVNFLVGENSAGKTSLLALIRVIFSPDFWFANRFNSEEHEFGGFRDMLSANASNAAEFSFGVIQMRQVKGAKKLRRAGFVASFKEHEGLPLCSFFTHIANQKLVSIKSQGGRHSFTMEEIPKSFEDKGIEEIFRFVESRKEDSKITFKEVSQKIPSRIGLLPLFRLVHAISSGKKGSEDEHFLEMPFEPFDLTWLAPIRTRPRRTYDGYGKDFSPEGEHTPYILRKRLSSTEQAQAFKKALESFGKASGLFRKVGTHNLGKEAASPFEVMVTLTSKALRINSVGYGVSQVLPLLVEILVRPKGSWFAIQQPEVHLHPKAQAALGDLIFEVAKNDGKRFLIETHSDFTVDRFRMNFKANKDCQTAAQILFFERSGEGNRVSAIPILPNGEYSREQPVTFRDFFLKEQIDLLDL
jgi:hypothetical protein